MTVKERLMQFIRYSKLPVNRFEKICGLSTGYVGNMRVSIQPDKIMSIANKFPCLNTGWLLTGEGSMLKGDTATLPIAAVTKEDKITALNNMMDDIQQHGKRRGKTHFIPLVNIDAVGGLSNDTCDVPEYIEELIPVTGARESSICLPVSGDSMMPIFLPGDLVVVDEVVEWSLFLEMGQYYVISLKDSRRLIKKVTYSEVDRTQNFLLVSENPKYPPVELPKTLINRMFIVTQKHQKITL